MLPEAGTLLARRQSRLRGKRPELPAAYAEVCPAAAAVEALWQKEDASGVAALRAGRLVAYLVGERVIDAVWGRSAWVRFAGCAHAPEEDPEIVRDLYAVLAAPWVRWGCNTHFALVPVDDRVLMERWFALSFGIEQVHALLSLDEQDLSSDADPPDLEIRPAGREDRAILEDLSDIIWRHQVQAPIWGIHLPEEEARQRTEYGNLVDEADVAVFLAFLAGEAVGLQAYYPVAADPRLPEGCVHLAAAGTRESARGKGVGRALTRRVLEHARAAGYRYCETDWRSTNLLASRVWPRLGFRPIVYRLARRVDSRIAWAGERE
jgi:GNAT superfamily N-acetyltransferase